MQVRQDLRDAWLLLLGNVLAKNPDGTWTAYDRMLDRFFYGVYEKGAIDGAVMAHAERMFKKALLRSGTS